MGFSSRKVSGRNCFAIIVFLISCITLVTGCSEETEQPEDTVMIDGDLIFQNNSIANDTAIEDDSKEWDTQSGESQNLDTQSGEVQEESHPPEIVADSPENETQVFINPQGSTLESRIAVPVGYVRVAEEEGSFGQFIRDYPMKEDGSPVLLYDGSEKGNQDAHAAVFAMPLRNEDLQQCADSVMKMYTEYFYQSGQPERIQFHLTNGFLFDYLTWRDGGRLAVSGNTVSWKNSASYDDSYDNLQSYLRMLFIYAGTASMQTETEETTLQNLGIGDLFLKGGSPGHVCLVADMCEMDGKKAFLLAQGYMPAQEFHVLKNEAHEEDPWYYEEEISYPFVTPEYVFNEGSLRHPLY